MQCIITFLFWLDLVALKGFLLLEFRERGRCIACLFSIRSVYYHFFSFSIGSCNFRKIFTFDFLYTLHARMASEYLSPWPITSNSLMKHKITSNVHFFLIRRTTSNVNGLIITTNILMEPASRKSIYGLLFNLLQHYQ